MTHRQHFLNELTLDSTNTLLLFFNRLIKNKFAWDNLLSDAQSLHRVFTPSRMIHKNRTVAKYSLEKFLASPPDAIIIMGNNDLRQVEYVGWLCKLLSTQWTKSFVGLKKHPAEKKATASMIHSEALPHIYISGKGGHATTAGRCLNHFTEADTFKQRLTDLGIPSSCLTLEKNATHTGENIKLTEQLMVNGGYKKILIASAPVGLLRQLKSYENQSQLSWESICTLPEPWEQIKKHYYEKSISAAAINFISMLNEAVKYIYYSINKDYMATEPIHVFNTTSMNKLAIKKLMKILVKYFNYFTNKKVDAKDLSELYIKYFYEKDTSCLVSLNNIIKPLFDYFGALFSLTENHVIKKIDYSPNLRMQSLKLYDAYNKYGLDIPVKSHRTNFLTNQPPENKI